MKRTYLIVFEKGKDCWSAFAPDVPGTGGMGDTIAEARQSLREGIGYILDYAVQQDQSFPEAAATSVDFSEFDPDPAESHYEIEWLTVALPERASAPQTHTEDRAQQAA
jgi:predicted RNase H-like HicB family nuclease